MLSILTELLTKVGLTLLISLLLLLLVIVTAILFSGIDRKLAARLQSRIGPPIIQPWRDFVKLLSKQTIIPSNSISWLFNFAPVMALLSVFLLVLYVPFIDLVPTLGFSGDLIVVIYLLMIPAIAMMLGGFSSGSRYAAIGAQRKMVLMMSYEFPLVITIVGVVWILTKFHEVNNGFSFVTLMNVPLFSHVGGIGFVGGVFLFFALFTALCAELIKAPFDAPEADTELAGGILVEYSGRNLAMFVLADMIKLVVFLTLIIGIFFPYKLSDFVVLNNFYLVGNTIFFLLKMLVLMVVGLTFVRSAFARLKITQITKFYWVFSTGLSLVGVLLLYIDALL